MDNINILKYKEAIKALDMLLSDVDKTTKMIGHIPSAEYIISTAESFKKIYESMIILSKESEDHDDGLKIILRRS